jgi:hypothetical protein
MIVKRQKEIKNPIHLRYLGLCGIDSSFNPPINQVWPSYIEFGFLFREELVGNPRFPSIDWIETFIKEHPDNSFAGHLCSKQCEAVCDGIFDFVSNLIKMGIKRFQINCTKANGVNVDRLEQHCKDVVLNIMLLAATFPLVEIIIQRNNETKWLWFPLEVHQMHNISFLFDASVGKGIEIQDFEKPLYKSLKYGYAGGLNSDNLKTVMEKIQTSHLNDDIPDTIWVDMESGLRIREEKDRFSWEKAKKVVDIVQEMILDGEVLII